MSQKLRHWLHENQTNMCVIMRCLMSHQYLMAVTLFYAGLRKIFTYVFSLFTIWAATCENIPSDMCARRRFRSACAFVQSDQNPPWAQFGLWRMQIFFMRTTKTLIRLVIRRLMSSLGAHLSRYVFSSCGSFSDHSRIFVCVCVEVLGPRQAIRVMSSAVSLSYHTFSWAGLRVVFLTVNQYLCTLVQLVHRNIYNSENEMVNTIKILLEACQFNYTEIFTSKNWKFSD